MICPHCLKAFHDHWSESSQMKNSDGTRKVRITECPACEKSTVELGKFSGQFGWDYMQVYPKGSTRPPVPAELPDEFAEDYLEACLVLTDSPKASAALSRRCLQHILREKAGVKKKDLNSEIDSAIPLLPSHLADLLHMVRTIGNFAAHPLKSTSTGEVVPVDFGEAEAQLEVLEGLFDFYFVQPKKNADRKAAMNAKLAEVGKPPLT